MLRPIETLSDFALEDPETSHLRSANEVRGDHIAATDQDIGHIQDFVLDDETWVIRYLALDTSNWLGGRLVVIAPDWIERIDWLRARVRVNVTSRDIRESPEFDPSNPGRRTSKVSEPTCHTFAIGQLRSVRSSVRGTSSKRRRSASSA
jgi:hypothetical protein